MFWTEWSVPRVWKTRRIFQLFENFLWARRDDKVITQHKTSQDDENSCKSSILRRTAYTQTAMKKIKKNLVIVSDCMNSSTFHLTFLSLRAK